MKSEINDIQTFSFILKLNGNDLSEKEGVDIINVSINKQFNKISTAEVILYYGNLLNNEFVDDKAKDIAIGSEIEITTVGEKGLCVFKGIIIKQAISIANSNPLMKITAKNKAFKMTQSRENSVFANKKDQDIISDIIAKYGINYEVESTPIKNEAVTQYNITDWDFINIRAEANSMLIFTDEDKIIVKKPSGSKPKFEIDGYNDIIEIDAILDGSNSFSQYSANMWDYNTQEIIEVTKQNNSSDFNLGSIKTKEIANKLQNNNFNININSNLYNTDVIKEKIDSVIMRNNLSRIIGRTKIYGINIINPGEFFTISGVGEKFNGDAFVTGVEYNFDNGAWITTINFGLEETPYCWCYDNINPAASAEMNTSVNGLIVGKVVALAGAPNDDFRIKISLPCFQGDNTEIWARLSNLTSGDGRGCFFMPEINDEVIVGFIDENPNNAVVLGSLFNKKMPPPNEINDDNNIKGFYFKSKIKFEFNEKDKIVTLETPGNNRFVMDDKNGSIEICDKNGNKITTNNKGIVIKSIGKLQLEATSDLSIKGVNIKSEANASYKAEGKANTEISSSGVTILKGSIVQIN